MKKLPLALVTVSALSMGLIGCGMRDTATGAGVGAATGAGVGFAATGGNPAGAAVGAGIGAGAGAVTGALVGKRATDRDMVVYRKKGVVYHDGKAYHIKNGRYVIVR